MDARRGFEPRLKASKASVLPLDDRAMVRRSLLYFRPSLFAKQKGAGMKDTLREFQTLLYCCSPSSVSTSDIPSLELGQKEAGMKDTLCEFQTPLFQSAAKMKY